MNAKTRRTPRRKRQEESGSKKAGTQFPRLVGGGSPFAFLGGVCFIWPALAFGVAEWFLHVRNARNLERPLGVVCGLVGGLAVFAFISNGAEAAVKGGSPGVLFWAGFGAVCFAIAAYGLWCCWLRAPAHVSRRTRFPRRPSGGTITTPQRTGRAELPS